MKKLPFFLLLILLLVINSVDSQTPALWRYVLQWPPTYCMELNSGQGTTWGRCQEPIPQREFTLHGLWPADADGKIITCPEKPDPNWNQLFRPIEDKLVKFWPQLRENSNSWDLWKHEWRSHGVCGGTTPEVYFNRAIGINNMFKMGNLFNYLATSGIIACDSLAFSREEIIEAVRKVFPPPPPALDVYLTCIPINDKNKSHVYLREVTLCINLAGNAFISCPEKGAPSIQKFSCSTGAKIMLPHPKAQPSAPPPPRLYQENIDGTAYV
ncbi:intracellular ribonuclease LX-like [Lycium barbarum]|uniref:intracellular ribonuclease LX-like n=1 Tax=Lycium barbarum TaxID=112863 RepID=UPI00293F3085|nr:intracellular ribonuclease LX-like [Lycium barbarum]